MATITGLEIESLCADLTTFVPGRQLDDDGNLLLRFTNGARGVLISSQIEIGCENDLRMRVFGSTGTLDWRQEEPNTLLHSPIDGPRRILTRGSAWLGEAARRATRFRPGIPRPSSRPLPTSTSAWRRTSARCSAGTDAADGRSRLPDPGRRCPRRALHREDGRVCPQRTQVDADGLKGGHVHRHRPGHLQPESHRPRPRPRVRASASVPLTVVQPQRLWREQHPAQWWSACQQALQAALTPAAAAGIPAQSIEAIGLTGQMHGATLLDARGEVLRPAILWNDGRAHHECRELEARVPTSRQITGNLMMPGFTAPKLLWLAQHEPELFSRIDKVLLPKDYLRWCLTGDLPATCPMPPARCGSTWPVGPGATSCCAPPG